MMCRSTLLLVFLYLCAAEDSPLVSFGELTEVHLQNDYHPRTVESLEEDWLSPGGFIISNQHSVTVISPDLAVTVLAGHENETASSNGVGSMASFSTVTDTAQYNGGEDVIVADLNNNCIRNVNKASARVTTFAGTCGRSGEIEGTQKASDVLLNKPASVIYHEEKDVFYYLLRSPSSIIEHDRVTDNLVQRYIDREEFKDTWAFLPDSTYSYLYVTHSGGISKISTSDWSRTLVTGLNRSRTVADSERADGTLATARYDTLARMDWLIPDQVLVVNGYDSHSLRIVNLVDDSVTSICVGEYLRIPAHTLGGQDVCKMSLPSGVLVVNGTIYIGEETGKDGSGIGRLGHILKLPYQQPLCTPPSTANLNGSYRPLRDVYTHKQTIKYTCDSGFGISVSYNYNTITCIRDVYSNGTVYGRWDMEPPSCQALEVLSVSPLTGQRNGGTIIKVDGTVASDIVAVVEYSNQQSATVNLTRQSINSLTFPMAPKLAGTSDVAMIHMTRDGSNVTISTSRYTYLENPSVDPASRLGSIARGGLLMTFKGQNLNSAYKYVFKVYQDYSLASQKTCTNQTGYIECYTPNVEHLFNKSNVVKRSTDIQSLQLTAVLYADDKPVSGALDIPYPVANTFPEFTNFSSQAPVSFDLDAEELIALKGNDLNISLTIKDYTITLSNRDNLISCEVSAVSRYSLTCKPDKENIRNIFPPSDYSFDATIRVKVGRVLDVELGAVSFYAPEGKPTDAPVKPDKSLVIIPVVISVVVVLVVIVLFLVWKFRRSQSGKFVEQLVDPAYSKDTVGMEQLISADVRMKLEDMYIDSSMLTFDLKSDPIGKGHFGNVYWGQLRVKGNILKTVAVKTLKVTDDISTSQLEDFLQEASFVKYYNHANVLITLGVVWRKGDRPLVVLPYMALGDLRSLVMKPDMRFTNGDLMHFGMQVATGMEFLTENKCLHRDLAARNCLVSETFLVKIGDFGMSKDVYTDNYYRESNRAKPKPAKWMALESLRDGVYNSETEVWSFGVLMWELFTRGGVPYLELSNQDVFAHLQAGNRLHKPTYTHHYVFEEISKCWDVMPSERPTFTQLKHFLEECLLNSGQNIPDLQSEELTGESFQYSYARDLTRLLPEDYVHNDLYEDVRMDIDYRPGDKIDDYEQPVPKVIAPSHLQNGDRSVYGLDSLPNNLQQAPTNEYVLMMKDEQTAPKSSPSVDVDGDPVHTTPTPQPRISLGNRQASAADTGSPAAARNGQVQLVMNEYETA